MTRSSFQNSLHALINLIVVWPKCNCFDCCKVLNSYLHWEPLLAASAHQKRLQLFFIVHEERTSRLFSPLKGGLFVYLIYPAQPPDNFPVKRGHSI